MGEGVSQSRQTAIESFGAEVVRVGGSYDDVVARSESDAAEHGYFVISNVAYPSVDVPNLIMHGYACTGDEIATQLGHDDPPTHVFICGGGGRFGAGVAAALWQRYGAARPRCVMVEPVASAALQVSVITRTFHCASLWELRVITLTLALPRRPAPGRASPRRSSPAPR